MGPPASLNNRGFTLVEMLVAMVIVLVLLLSLVQAALLSIDGNLRNLLRDEGVRIAEQRMNGTVVDKDNNRYHGLKDSSFDFLSNSVNHPNWTCTASPVVRSFRNIAKKEFSVCWRIRTLSFSSEVLNLEVAVGWDHRNELPALSPTGREYHHTISSILRR
jgi:prepilin-type N-terminal cleavage/methylation domain-containing protein